jgi:hypothetical protein
MTHLVPEERYGGAEIEDQDGDFILPLLQSRIGIFPVCGGVLVERLGAMVPGGTDILWCGQARVLGLVRRAVGLRCPELVMRRRHSISRCWVQGMQSRLPAPRRAASLPVLIQS